MDAASVQTQCLWIYGAKEIGFVQTFNGFRACSRVMNYISPQFLVDKTVSFSIRNIWLKDRSECVLYSTSLTTLYAKWLSFFVYSKFYVIRQTGYNRPSFCPHSALRPSFFVWTSEQIRIIGPYLILSCNRDDACLLRGPNWIFIYSSGSG